MDCLKDYIGLRGCTVTTPESGLWLNTNAGVSTAIADNIANSEQINYSGLWADVQANAIAKFRTAVSAAFTKKYKLKSIRSMYSLGKKITIGAGDSPAAEWRGWSVSNIYDTMLGGIWVENLLLYLQSPSSDDIDIKIFDLENNEELFSYTLLASDTVQGWNKIDVKGYYQTNSIFCAYDGTNTTGVLQNIAVPFGTPTDMGCACNTIVGIAYVNGGASVDLNDPYDNEKTGTSYGLSGQFTISCRYDNLICNNKPLFASSWMACLSSVFMWFRYTSTRLNDITLIGKDEAKELIDHYEVLFEKELATAVDSITLDATDGCVECNTLVTHQFNKA